MKDSQIRLVVLRAIDFAQIEKKLEDMKIEAAGRLDQGEPLRP